MLNVHKRLRRAGAVVGCAVLIGAGLGVGATSAGADEEPTETTVVESTTTLPETTTTVPAPTVCPSETENGRFLRYLYLNIMYRCPDEGGEKYWENQLDNGASRAGVADALDMSTENLVNNNAIEYYQMVFDRDPSAAETAAAVASIRRTHGDAELLGSMYATDEFFGNFDSTSQWLGAVYNAILDRDPDAGGAAYFEGILGDNPTVAQRARVTKIMEHSSENAGGWTAAAMGAAFHRGPDGPGMGFWIGWLMSPNHYFQTFRMWTLMLSSNEGFTLAQTQPNPAPEGGHGGETTD